MVEALLAAVVIAAVVRLFTPARTSATARPPTVTPHLTEMQLYRPYQFTDLAIALTGEIPKNFYLEDLRQRGLPPVSEAADAAGVPERSDVTVQFKAHEPQRFTEFDAQQHIMRPLQAAVAAMDPHERVVSHRLLTGLPGRGKTLIARILAHELQLRAAALRQPPLLYLETFAANLVDHADFDRLVRQLLAAGGGIWFIDELHVLPRELGTKLYALMEDGRYPFYGSTTPTAVPHVMIVGATTDYGGLHDALKRRFGEPLMVRGLNRAELAHVVRRTTTITDDAVELLVDRTHWAGAPWEAVMLAREARTFAKAVGREDVRAEDVSTVFEIYEIDTFGLRWIDRQVLQALRQRPRYRGKAREFVCFAASEADVCAVVGLDPEEYRATVKPRLMTRGLLEVMSGYGQALTSRAVEWLSTTSPSPPHSDHPPHP